MESIEKLLRVADQKINIKFDEEILHKVMKDDKKFMKSFEKTDKPIDPEEKIR